MKRHENTAATWHLLHSSSNAQRYGGDAVHNHRYSSIVEKKKFTVQGNRESAVKSGYRNNTWSLVTYSVDTGVGTGAGEWFLSGCNTLLLLVGNILPPSDRHTTTRELLLHGLGLTRKRRLQWSSDEARQPRTCSTAVVVRFT